MTGTVGPSKVFAIAALLNHFVVAANGSVLIENDGGVRDTDTLRLVHAVSQHGLV